MAGESKSDNKLFQILMVVVTTIVAPVSVYFVTHSLSLPAAPTPPSVSTLSAPVNAASMTASPDPLRLTLTSEPSRTATAAGTPTLTAIPGVQNPRGILPAGELGIVNGLAVSVISDEVQVKDGAASIQIHVRNFSSRPQTFSYRVQSISVKDANNRPLEVMYGDKRNACSKKELSADRKIELAANQEIILQSLGANSASNWCAPDDLRTLPLYQVPTRDAPKSLEIQFSAFGPFNGFGFKIDF